MLGHCLSCSKSSRYCRCSAFCNRKQRIQNSLSGDKRNRCRISFACRSRNTNRPFLGKLQWIFASVCLFYYRKDFAYVICPIRKDFLNLSFYFRRYHGLMHNRSRFLCLRKNGSSVDFIALFYQKFYIPFFLCIQRIDLHPSGNIFSGLFCNNRKRTLNTIKNIV